MIKDIMNLNGKVKACDLSRYKVFYSKPDPFLSQLATLIAIMMNTSVAVIDIIDKPSIWNRQYRRPKREDESGLVGSLCSLAILDTQVMNFNKMVEMPHLFSNPLLVGEHGCQYFFMVSINSNKGLNVGSICLADKIRRDFTKEEIGGLDQAVDMIKTEMSNRYPQ